MVGRFDRTKFRFAGKVRYGFAAEGRRRMCRVMCKLRSRGCSIVDLPNVKADPFDENVVPEEMGSFVWIRRGAELGVEYREWTRMGSLRHPEFQSFVG